MKRLIVLVALLTVGSIVPRKGEAKAIVIHDMMTMSGGLAGPKLACISMPF